ncbi:hypothetical protein AVEN_125973-1 [Araneus ventricosus]|uniref:Uncharacterized protein n=1 Tax=Araneus ventricosus TaxID=182803 RepID=A0A4Y2SZR5_ARAVE|nr:hypothetical protein AVEN_125973-1 [Araneus ventricosus]
MENVLRVRNDNAKIWGALMVPWAILKPKNQVCNVNSFRDILKNVLRMRKDMAKIWGASMIPWVIHIPKNQVCSVNSFGDIMKNVLRMHHAKYEMTDEQTNKQTKKRINNALSSSSELCLKFQVSSSSGS